MERNGEHVTRKMKSAAQTCCKRVIFRSSAKNNLSLHVISIAPECEMNGDLPLHANAKRLSSPGPCAYMRSYYNTFARK